MGRSKAESSWRKRTSKADCKEEVVITRGKLDGGVRDDIIQNEQKDEMSFYLKKNRTPTRGR